MTLTILHILLLAFSLLFARLAGEAGRRLEERKSEDAQKQKSGSR